MKRNIDIHKAAGILIKDRRLLLDRSKGKSLFQSPGGKIESGESIKQALIRELMEELQVTVVESGLELFGIFYAPAADQEHKWLRMDVFIVKQWHGEPKPGREVEEIKWVSSKLEPGMTTGSIFEHEVMPQLKQQNLID